MDKLKTGAAKLGIALTPRQLEQFEAYYAVLIDWNQRINLTAITDYEEAQVKHFLDSLTATRVIDFKDKSKKLSIIDVGTGAGLPGIPLKIAFPDIQLTLLEATLKKTKFLEAITAGLNLKDVEIVPGRAETVAHLDNYRGKFDVAISRALAALPALVELTLPFCRIGGRCIAMKKGDIYEEIEQSPKAIELMGGELKEIKPVQITGPDDDRQLIVIKKVSATPDAYPRRPGIPEKRPVI